MDVAEPGRTRRGSEGDARSAADYKPVTNAYTRRLQLYRGEIAPDAVVTRADTDEVQVATLAFGLGNWYFVRGDKAQARTWFERSTQSGGWPGFGFIVSECGASTLIFDRRGHQSGRSHQSVRPSEEQREEVTHHREGDRGDRERDRVTDARHGGP